LGVGLLAANNIVRRKEQFLSVVFSLALPLAVFGQGTFQNLNFEMAQLPVIPAGQSGGTVSISNALPYWRVFMGADEVFLVRHNDPTLTSRRSAVGIYAVSETIFLLLSKKTSFPGFFVANLPPHEVD
jgi:hypothetical protein